MCLVFLHFTPVWMKFCSDFCTANSHSSFEEIRANLHKTQACGQRTPGSTTEEVVENIRVWVDRIVIALYLARTLNISWENYPSAAVM